MNSSLTVCDVLWGIFITVSCKSRHILCTIETSFKNERRKNNDHYIKDGSRNMRKQKAVIDIAYMTSAKALRAACAGEVNGEVVDLFVQFLTATVSWISLERRGTVLRHTASHVTAGCTGFPAEQRLPSDHPWYRLLTMISTTSHFRIEDLDAIEKEMKRSSKRRKDQAFYKIREDASYFKEMSHTGLSWSEDLPEGEEISFYSQETGQTSVQAHTWWV